MKKAFGWLVLGVFLAVSGVEAAPADPPAHRAAKKKIKKAPKKNAKRKAAHKAKPHKAGN